MATKEYQKCAKDMLEFIEKSPTCFHAAANLKSALRKQGFEELWESESWELRPGGGYFVTRNDSSLIAFRLPDKETEWEGAGTKPSSEASCEEACTGAEAAELREEAEEDLSVEGEASGEEWARDGEKAGKALAF